MIPDTGPLSIHLFFLVFFFGTARYDPGAAAAAEEQRQRSEGELKPASAALPQHCSDAQRLKYDSPLQGGLPFVRATGRGTLGNGCEETWGGGQRRRRRRRRRICWNTWWVSGRVGRNQRGSGVFCILAAHASRAPCYE